MKLPKREYFPVQEVAARWGYTVADIAGWSAAGNFDIVTGIPPVTCGDEIVAGEVIIPAFDILPMFRRMGTGPHVAAVHRVRTKGKTDWMLITDPADGIAISDADLLIPGQQAQRFEVKNGLMRRIGGGTGSEAHYDWEGMLQALALRIHDLGVPASQGELVAAMLDWFATNSRTGDIPDESSVRRRVRPVWRALMRRRETA